MKDYCNQFKPSAYIRQRRPEEKHRKNEREINVRQHSVCYNDKK